jgi:uncharacterized protein YcaQ
MSPVHLQQREARQIAVRAALLDATPVADLDCVVRQLAMLRVELTSTVVPAADHIAWTRLKNRYWVGDADRALADRELFERDWMLRPMDQLPLYLAGMRTWADRSGSRAWMDSNGRFQRSILERIEAEGPLTSKQIPDTAVVPVSSTGWNNNRNVTIMLQCLHMTGDLAVVGRRGRFRVWDLAERVFPPVAEVAYPLAHRIRSEQILAAHGIQRDGTSISPTELHNVDLVGVEATIEGVPGNWRVDPAQLDRDFVGRTAILSPFDRLVFDRERIAHLFDYDYMLEMYKPAEQRIWGQFALPILHNENLVGKVDARTDAKKRTLAVGAVHGDVPFTRAMSSAVDDELDSLAAWLDYDRT